MKITSQTFEFTKAEILAMIIETHPELAEQLTDGSLAMFSVKKAPNSTMQWIQLQVHALPSSICNKN